jgi:hypothetical protein
VVKRSTPTTLYTIRLSSNIQRFEIDEINNDRHQTSTIHHLPQPMYGSYPTTHHRAYDVRHQRWRCGDAKRLWPTAMGIISDGSVVGCRVSSCGSLLVFLMVVVAVMAFLMCVKNGGKGKSETY